MFKSKDATHNSEASNGEHDSPTGKEKGKDKAKSKLPLWLNTAIRKPRVWKTWTRCMVATFATLVLMLAQPSAFFGLIMSQIIPPFMAVGLFLIAMMTMMVGIAMGWAWGAAAMAAGLQARSQVLLNEQVQREQAGYNAQYNIEQQYQQSIFRGAFLDPRSSAVYGVFMFFGAYFFGFVRAKLPRMTLFAIFGTIILDLMCSYGPLFPIAQYTLAKTLLTPAACYIAIALVSSVLIFPQSLNHIVLSTMTEQPLQHCLSQLKLQDRVLATSDPAQWEALATEAKEGRLEFSKIISEMEGQVKMLRLEVTRGRTSAADLTRVHNKLKELGGRMYGMTSFVILLDERAKATKRLQEDDSQGVFRQRRRVEDLDKLELEGTDYASLLPILESSTAPVRQAAIDGLEESIRFLHALNHSRWTSPKNLAPTSVREENVARLRTALNELKTQGQFRLLDNFKDLFDERTGEPKESIPMLTYAARNLFRCQVFTTTLSGFADSLVEWLDLLLEIEKANPKPTFQFPGSGTAKAAVDAANDKEGGSNPMEMGVNGDDASSTSTLVEGTDEKKGKGKVKQRKTYAKDPDAGDPTNWFQKLGRKVHAGWKGVASPEGIFALKYALVSVALWVPQVTPASAQFVYENRGLWALIMAQTGLGVFTGEQVFSFVSRITGTIAGLVVGMVVWYIGAARGPGNPYGIAAALMVFIAPFLFLRINSPPQLQGFFVMVPVTIVFVVGYSWVDSHIFQTANQGVGAALAGRRALLVIIGFVGGFIIMVFPKPISAKTRARLSLARIVSELGDLYGSEISGFEVEIDPDTTDKELNVRGRQEKYRGQFLKIFARFQATQPQLGFARFEPSTRGPWPAKQYGRLVACIGQIINALALLSNAYGHMNREWARRLAENADTLHPSFIADTLALFALMHTGLKNAHPLPPTIPLFERLFYHQDSKHALRSQAQSQSADLRRPRRPSKITSIDGDVEDEDHVESQEAEIVQSLGRSFTYQTLHDEQFAVYATANVALLHLTNALNEMHLVVKELVGEKELEGFQIAQERWAGLERG